MNELSAAPARSHAQRMGALGRANEIRTFRAELKKDVKAGGRSVTRTLADPPAELATMKVSDLLLSVPSLGRVKVNRLLVAHRISPSKTVGGLTSRQRGELMVQLRWRETAAA